jgi:leader peptidase (prepilin peptidase) / N-methyltransferase
MIVYVWLAFFFGCVFVLGSAVGSFLNVVVYRVPRGKNLFWPPSRCGACLGPVAPRDNVPLLSYWRLGGRCRTCGAAFSMRYFWIELACGLGFVLLYLLEVGLNVQGFYPWGGRGFSYLEWGGFPPQSWPLFLGHAFLAALLFAAALCLVQTGGVPRPLAVAGAVGGLCWALLYPWPAPTRPQDALRPSEGPAALSLADGLEPGPMPAEGSWAAASESPRPGFVPWPVWGPLPAWLPPGGLLLGLATALAGLFAGQGLVRLINGLHRSALGREVLGPPAAALLLLGGGFLGWQIHLVALALAVLLALPAARLLGDSQRGFGVALAVALAAAWLGWGELGPLVRPWLFDPVGVAVALACVSAALLGLGWVLPS